MREGAESTVRNGAQPTTGPLPFPLMGMKPSQPDQPKPGVNVDALMEQIRAELGQGREPARPAAGSARLATEPSPMPALSTEDLMARVRAEIARRRSGSIASDATGESALAPGSIATVLREYPLPHWQPAAPRLPEQPQYALNDFLRFDDADFIDVAYEKLLKRPADPVGRRGYLDALRSGAVSKVEILGDLRFSEEGRNQGVHVDGLLLPYKLHRWRHVRVIGWVLGMGIAVWRLPRLAWRLQGMEASAAREAQEMGRLVVQVEGVIERYFVDVNGAMRGLRNDLTQTVTSRVESLRVAAARVEALQAAMESAQETLLANDGILRAQVQSVSDALRVSDTERGVQFKVMHEALAASEAKTADLAKQLDANTNALHHQIQSVVDAQRSSNVASTTRHKQHTDRLAVHEAALSRLDEQTQSDHRSLRALLDRLTFFLDASAHQVRKGAGEDGEAPSLEQQYASFEQTFRGDREQIKQRAAHYLDTLVAADIKAGDEGVVLDLGSGRGEWLEVLAEHGYQGRGVDSNCGMLDISRAHGHDVVEADALEYLHAQPSDSFAAITSMHMVEHMPHPLVIRLLDEALRVLRPAGVLILETPNPENVLVGSCMFYMDPTHLHPIPPPLLQWTVQARGFEQVVIERLSKDRGAPELTPVSGDVPGAAQINQMVAWFTAAPDYAVVARKSTNPERRAC